MTRMSIVSLALASALGLWAAPRADAATVVLTETLDLTQASLAPSGISLVSGVPPFSASFNVTLAEGDALDFTIDFLGSQTLTLSNPTAIWAFIVSATPTYVTGTGSFSFLGPNGLPWLTSSVKTQTGGNAHFGQYFVPGDFAGGLPSPITFSGVRYVGTVDDYVDPAVIRREYRFPALYFEAAANAIGTSTPEPSVWTMMIAGFSAIGVALRARRKAAVRYA